MITSNNFLLYGKIHPESKATNNYIHHIKYEILSNNIDLIEIVSDDVKNQYSCRE